MVGNRLYHFFGSLVFRLLMSFGLCCPLVVVAQDTITAKTNYYAIVGKTAWELRASLDGARPWKNRIPGDASTQWNVRWSFKTIASESGCRLESLEVKATITLTLPRWRPAAETPADLQTRWQTYLSALEKHEEGHRTLAERAAAEVGRQVRAMGAAQNCEALAQSIKKMGNSIIDEYRRKEAEYDRETQHGVTQGARFP